ncbi:MAG: hypothetical protein KF822_00720 [Steroidobacteraceae bacterium]|nr:hypothetical protein [Steroidobacteraceae bacterium]
MYHDTIRSHPGIGTALAAALAAVQVLALAIAAAPERAPGGRPAQTTTPVLLPEIVVTAPRTGS